MRLLNSSSLKFEEFFDNEIPPYVILSHRWAEKEVSFQDFQDAKDRRTPEFSKIAKSCALANMNDRDWIWIDTCCIDKKSSAELTEAINSMFRWYREAEICYAYLSDVEWDLDALESSRRSFRASAWFTRGWTLQELLAPMKVSFFDRQWEVIGTKISLEMDISAATGIGVAHLTHFNNGSDNMGMACVAMKMSWAAKRETSRVEDMAYCLLGIFDVNMPLLYGEGRKAFMRLQLEIIRKSNDESIFAWSSSTSSSGLLAAWPSAFAGSGDITTLVRSDTERLPYAMTNKGLEFHVPGSPLRELTLALKCWRKLKDGYSRPITIRLEKGFDKSWRRTSCFNLDLCPDQSTGSVIKLLYEPQISAIYIRQDGL